MSNALFAVLQYAIFLAVVTVLVRPVGMYLYRVFEGQRTVLDPVLRPIERAIYRVCAIRADQDMNWREYALAFVLFSAAGIVVLFVILLIQPILPGYDARFITTPMTIDLALNTAVSFATTTTWQAYGGETTMGYSAQMVGLAAQNFLAGASGLAVGVAFMRGFARQNTDGLGNFWVDVVRATLWVLLPIALVGVLVLVWQGVPMNTAPYTEAATLEGDAQTIAQGPAAALEIIKNLGTAGGGFFNVNGAHPYANPTPFTNLFTLLTIVVVPAALTATFGRMVGNPRHGWLLYGVMVFFFVAGLFIVSAAEVSGNPTLGIVAENMEGKELRFGVHGTALAVVTTSNGATGSVNAMHASLMPASAGVALFNMLLGEIVFGGLGTGIYSIVFVALTALFMGGLMIGRAPEYLGKKITESEVKLIAIYILMAPFAVLVLTALAVIADAGRAGIAGDTGAHGFTSILIAYTTSVANNGQNFANLSANTPFYHLTTIVAMLVGRFGLALPALALAGSFAARSRRPEGVGTVPAHSLIFALLVIGVAVIVGALSFFPALAVGPIVEALSFGGQP